MPTCVSVLVCVAISGLIGLYKLLNTNLKQFAVMLSHVLSQNLIMLQIPQFSPFGFPVRQTPQFFSQGKW